jgi:DNA polymerase III alpha subunit
MFKNYVTPHCHQSSFDTGSTPKQFIARELELETGYTTVTDHGSLAAAREVFDLAKEKKITPIVGLEAYFRDDDCPILKAEGIQKGVRYRHRETGSVKEADKWEDLDDKEKLAYEPEYGYFNYWKYAHLTMHFLDAEAYETGVRLLSAADLRAERHGSERKPLFGWKELEELGSKNVTFGSGCLIGMVQRHLLGSGKGFTSGNNPLLGFKYYERLRSIVKPGNFFVEAFPHVCTHNWESKVVIEYEDETTETFPEWKSLKTNVGEGIKAKDLAKVFNTRANEHHTLYEVMEQRKWVAREGKAIKEIRHDEGYVQNECRPWTGEDGDVQLGCNKFVMDLAKMHGDPVLISDDSHYAHKDEKIIQNVRLNSGGSWRFYGHHHRQSSQESAAYFLDVMGLNICDIEKFIDNSHAWADRFRGFGFKQRLSLPTSFYEGNTSERFMRLVQKHGRMTWGDQKYVDRLGSEITLLRDNGTVDLLPYFFVAEEVCSEYEKAGLLTGPGRGSAAGLLISYLLGITHVDPLKYGLSQERFLTLDRIKGGKFPDIDQDLPSRDLLVDPETGWLKKRFGDCYAQISTDTKLKLRSSVKDVMRFTTADYEWQKRQRIMNDVEELTKKFLQAPQGIEDHDFVHGYLDADSVMQKGSIEYDKALMEFIRQYPEEWAIVDRCLGLPRQKSRHACGYVICNEPVSNFIPLTSVSDVTVTQYTAKSVEAVGGLKMDYLVVNSLNDIQDCIRLIQERAGTPDGTGFAFPAPGESISVDGRRVPWFRLVPDSKRLYDIWDLPQDQEVFRDICEGRTETVFQFNTDGAKKWLRYFNHVRFTDENGQVHKALDTDEALAAFTALDRPGPLDYYVGADESRDEKGHNMLVEYARRASGEAPTGNLPVLDRLLPETMGVIVYQEQLQSIYQKVGRTDALQADSFRQHISKKQMEKVYKDKAIFMPGALQELDPHIAENLWQSMETFGKYGFNKSHAVCYASKIGYACAWLKHWYPLEWWTAVLRNASKNEVNEDFWPYCGKLVLMPDVAKSGDRFQVEGKRIRAPLNLLGGIGPEAHKQLIAGLPYSSIEDFCQKIQAHRMKNAKPVTKMMKDRKTGLEAPVTRLKPGTSALHRGVVYTLIQSGAMDSLFPPETTILEQLNAYEQALAVATQKKPEKVNYDKYGRISQLVRYQMRKSVLPVYSADLVPMLVDMGVQGIFERPYKTVEGKESMHRYIVYRKQNYRGEVEDIETALSSGQTFHFLNRDEEFPKGGLVAVAGFVKSARKFTYAGGEQGTKSAMEMVIDVEGFDFKLVRWSGKDGRLQSKYTEAALRGAIVLAVATKFDPRKPFAIEDIRIIQDPLSFKSEESSSATTQEKVNAQENPQALAS